MFSLNLGLESSPYAYHCDKPGTQQQDCRGYGNRCEADFNDQVIKVPVAATRQVFPGNDPGIGSVDDFPGHHVI